MGAWFCGGDGAMSRPSGNRNFRVDFVLIKPNPKQNRKAFTFTLARDEGEAEARVMAGHPGETLRVEKIVEVMR